MAILLSMWLFGRMTLIVPEYPCGSGWTSFTRADLSMLRPFSSEYSTSSAKYFLKGSWFPEATASSISWVRRTSSSWVMAGSSTTPCKAAAHAAISNTAMRNLVCTNTLLGSSIEKNVPLIGLHAARVGRDAPRRREKAAVRNPGLGEMQLVTLAPVSPRTMDDLRDHVGVRTPGLLCCHEEFRVTGKPGIGVCFYQINFAFVR